MAKCYREALPLLATPPEHVDPAKTAMTPRSFLLYCYYGAMIHIGEGAPRKIIHACLPPRSETPCYHIMMQDQSAQVLMTVLRRLNLACICAGRKTYADALRLLLHALTAPTFVVNAITLAAHAKYVLVCLIHTGENGKLPCVQP